MTFWLTLGLVGLLVFVSYSYHEGSVCFIEQLNNPLLFFTPLALGPIFLVVTLVYIFAKESGSI